MIDYMGQLYFYVKILISHVQNPPLIRCTTFLFFRGPHGGDFLLGTYVWELLVDRRTVMLTSGRIPWTCLPHFSVRPYGLGVLF